MSNTQRISSTLVLHSIAHFEDDRGVVALMECCHLHARHHIGEWTVFSPSATLRDVLVWLGY